WLLVVAVVTGVLIATRPSDLDEAAELAGLTPGQQSATVEALAFVNLDLEHLAIFVVVSRVATTIAFLVMGWLLVTRGRPAAFSTYLAIVMAALNAASYPPDVPDTYPGRTTLQIVILVMTVVAVSGFFTLPLLFPDGRFVPRWAALIGLYNLLTLIGFAFVDLPPMLNNAAVEVITTVALLTALIGIPLYRYLKVSTAEQRRQTRWVFLGFAIGLPCFFIMDAMMRNIDDSTIGIVNLFGFLILNPIAFNLPFLAVAGAILFHRLFDIDVLFGRTIVWLAMTAVVIATYVTIVLGVGAMLGTDDSLVLSLAATGLVAVAFQPVRLRVQHIVNRFVYGDRDDPYSVISRLGQQVANAAGIGDLLPQIVRTTAEALRLPYAALFLDRVEGQELVASAGIVSPSTVRLPLTYQGATIGTLEVAQRSPGEVFSASDRRLLDDLAHQIGIAAHTVTLATELQRSREEIVTSREEERRRLRRDLHDGLGAQLAALIMQTGAIRTRVRSDPDQAEQSLRELRDELRVAVDDVRRLVHGLRPPALDELGLVGALRARLDRIRANPPDPEPTGLMVSFDAPDQFPPLPAAVEVATVRIVDEAVTNVVRHSRATRLWVKLSLDQDALSLVVEDDGDGFDEASITPGIGLQSMRERARELGGTLTVVGRVSGTGSRVEARLPVMVSS
ncbi:MAG TPA: GAF domain-containing sensor histidine kinase, partial [Thermomicrobiales bacterium]|nr:GAF domain-containing sensor histidine kinase [Thermomicrobiales bacterium]